jgi:hypothetical protein
MFVILPDTASLTQGLCSPLLLVNEDGLLPVARRFVGAVYAACPATGAAFPFKQFLAGPLYPALSGRRLFRILNPANEFVAAKWRQALPKVENFGLRLYRLAQIILGFVNRSMEKIIGHIKSYSVAVPYAQQQPTDYRLP